MHIVCPHCTTSYAVDPANFPEAGRRVRCARCQEVWLAMPQELVSAAGMSRKQAEQANPEAGFSRNNDPDGWQDGWTPHIESPSISADGTETDAGESDRNWSSLAQHEVVTDSSPAKSSPFRGLRSSFGRSVAPLFNPANWARALPGVVTLPTICVALGAMVFALIAWRTEVVRVIDRKSVV